MALAVQKTATQLGKVQSTSRPHIALVGNPNSGKTSLFNRLTGSSYRVANYPGVTVEERRGYLKHNSSEKIGIIDLPGIYSLTGLSPDEQVTLTVLSGQMKDREVSAIICVLDSTNLERNLFLTSQVLELGLPTLVVLNMTDLAEKHGISLKAALLERLLGTRVIKISASDGTGCEQVKSEIFELIKTDPTSARELDWLSASSLPLKPLIELGAHTDREIDTDNTALHYALDLVRGTQQPTSKEQAEQLSQLTQSDERYGNFASFEASARYSWIHNIVNRVTERKATKHNTLLLSIDAFITHPWYGLIFFFGVMTLLFQGVFVFAAYPMDIIDSAITALADLLLAKLPDSLFRSLLVDGIIAGVGGVVIFIPQIAILFFFIGLLEDTGYLARAAYLMDRVMRKVGLQGRSFIPLLSSFACAIPGIMATRTIPSFADRMTTILVAPLMSCSARLPVYTLLVSALIPSKLLLGFISLQGLFLFGLYLTGILGASLVSLILRTWTFKGTPSLFVMEMPPFRTPSFSLCVRSAFERVKVFIRDAGTVILACTIVLWALASFPRGVGVKQSFAGQLGQAIEPAIRPLGYNWELGVAIIGSFAAREVFVSTLSTVYRLDGIDQGSEEASHSLLKTLRSKKASGDFSLATGLSLLTFYIFACQCISTLAVIARETGSWRWSAVAFGYMTLMAYTSSFVVYQLVSIIIG
jgi:ferrous iron transport protein B